MSAIDFAEMMDVEYSVDEYFEPEELSKMSPIEKRRYKNLRANYEVMKAMGKLGCPVFGFFLNFAWGIEIGIPLGSNINQKKFFGKIPTGNLLPRASKFDAF